MQVNLYPNFLKSEIYLCAVNGEDESASNLQEQLELPPNEGPPSARKSSSGDNSAEAGTAGGSGDDQQAKPGSSLAVPLVIDTEQKSEGQSPKIPSPPLSTAASVLLPNQLQTVHEDKELTVNPQTAAAHQHAAKLKLSLTKEALHMTQLARASVPGATVGIASKIRSREGFTRYVKM